ncbi:FluG domain-containing protein [Halenospora varia]|nr:FluG domain-containing protein [Halenospora varia]
MVVRDYTTVNLRLPQTSHPNLAQLNDRVKRRRPKPKIQPRPPEYYQNLIDQHDKTTVKRNYADTTKDNLQDIIDKFSRFCAHLPRAQHWRTIIRNCSKGTTIAFLIHICEVDRVKKRSTVHQYYLRFKMLFNRENGRHMDTNDAKEALAYIYGPLTRDFELDITVKEKPARDTSTFPTERHRVQFALILLLLFATGCRPAELVDAKKKKRRRPDLDDHKAYADDVNDGGFKDAKVSANADFGFDDHDSAVANLGSENDGNGSDDDVAISDVKTELRQFDALCYEDVRLLVVRNPIAGERDVLAIEAKLAHHKGAKRRPKPTIFFFTKVDDPIFCPITHLVSLAIADRAFEAPSLTTAERVFEHKVWGPVVCTPLTWKQEMLKTPIFRRDKRAANGVVTSPTLALTYSQFRDCLNRLGLAAGFLEKLTSYCFRRGTANVVDRAATDTVRDQVMRHNPNSAVYNGAYINERVPFDVLSAVLERPSADGILRMLTHISLIRDPRAPVHVPDDVLAALSPDPRIVDLEQQRAQLKAGAYRIQGTEVEAEVRRLTAEIADYFRRRPIEDIERQNSGQQEEEYIEPVVEHQIPERAQLAELICTHIAGITPQDIVKRRIHSAGLMLALCHRREVPRRYRLRVTLPQPPLVKEESPDLEPFPLVCAKTQCPFCIGDESKSYKERMGSFCRVSKMRDHVERIHLRGFVPEEAVSCRHPVCKSQGLVLKDLQDFKNHVQTVHGIGLRA